MPGMSAPELDPGAYNAYGYVPTESIAILFVALFSISTIAHTGQAFYYRMWWMLPTAVLCGVMEILGWSARLWSSISPLLYIPFTIQITATILGPTPLVAANFIVLGKIIQYLGPAYSRLSPKWYAIIFCTSDLIALAIQGVGGGLASSAAGSGGDPTLGGNIALGGIVFQMTMITLYVLCAVEFYIRYVKSLPVRATTSNGPARGYMDRHLFIMSMALALSTTCLFIRAIYRTIELSGGWSGRIFTTQVYFNILDGAMIVLAMFILNFAHPGVLLDTSKRQTETFWTTPKTRWDSYITSSSSQSA